MSTTALVEPAPQAVAQSHPSIRLTRGRAIRSEWIKLRTLRSTWLTLVGILLAIVVFGLAAASVATGSVEPNAGGPQFASASSPVGTVLSGANFAVLIVAVFGVMVGAREYSSGLIRVTLAAVPSRLPVLLGKLAVFIAVVTPVVTAGVLAAFFGGTAILSGAGADSAAWTDDGVMGAVLGTIGYLVGIGVLGVLLGMLFRSIAAGLGVLVGGILFLPTLATALLPDSWDSVLKYLPSNAGQAFTAVTSGGALLDYWAGVAVFSAWLLIALGAAAWALQHRDA